MVEFPTSLLVHFNEGKSQVEVCNFCGDRGFENALINCSECCETLVHQYCVGIPPGTIDENFNWICEFCCAQEESELHLSIKSFCASITGKRKKRKRRPPIPQCESPLTLGSKCKRIRKEKTEDESSSSTKVTRTKSSNSKDDINTNSLVKYEMDYSSSCMENCDGTTDVMPLDCGEGDIIPIPDEEQPEPLLTLLPIGSIGSSEKTECGSNNKLLSFSEDSEGGISSLMENPKETTRGIVLLVSPSGEIFIDEDSVFCDEDVGLYDQTLDTSLPTFSNLVDENGQNNAKLCSLETDMLDVPRSKSEGQEEIEGLEGKQTLDTSLPTFSNLVDENGQISAKLCSLETDMLDVPRSKSEGQEEIERLEGEQTLDTSLPIFSNLVDENGQISAKLCSLETDMLDVPLSKSEGQEEIEGLEGKQTLDTSLPTFSNLVDENGQISAKLCSLETDMLDVPRSKSEGQEEIERLEGEQTLDTSLPIFSNLVDENGQNSAKLCSLETDMLDAPRSKSEGQEEIEGLEGENEDSSEEQIEKL